jgi:3-oxoacyl-[acyl-carrier-protein] synthase II
MEAYIKSTGNISPQDSLYSNAYLDNPAHYTSDHLKCIEPDYKEFLNPALSRRMGRIIKMGVASAKVCLKNTDVEVPDAIIMGTGLGCIEDTEKFLATISDNQEKLLPPSSFIQSTHNTIAAQIALELKCHNYNLAYVHRGFSFESALLDALMLMNEGSASNVLLGGADELTSNSFQIMKRMGHWKRQNINSLNLKNENSKGTIAGEGSVFFLLTKEKEENSLAKISGVGYNFWPLGPMEVEVGIFNFLKHHNLDEGDIDLVLLGINSDIQFDGIYHSVREGLFPGKAHCYYKHLCGEYFTSSAFALTVASELIKRQNVPGHLKINEVAPKSINNILIWNHFRNLEHTYILVSKC